MAYIEGDNNDNVLTAMEGSAVYGYGGNDTLNGSAYYDLLWGGVGNDTIYGNGG